MATVCPCSADRFFHHFWFPKSNLILPSLCSFLSGQYAGAAPPTSTMALTKRTLPYAVALAKKGWKKCGLKNKGICEGLLLVAEKVTSARVAETFGMEYRPVADVLA